MNLLLCFEALIFSPILKEKDSTYTEYMIISVLFLIHSLHCWRSTLQRSSLHWSSLISHQMCLWAKERSQNLVRWCLFWTLLSRGWHWQHACISQFWGVCYGWVASCEHPQHPYCFHQQRQDCTYLLHFLCHYPKGGHVPSVSYKVSLCQMHRLYSYDSCLLIVTVDRSQEEPLSPIVVF